MVTMPDTGAVMVVDDDKTVAGSAHTAPDTQRRWVFVDVLNVVACLAVILLHVSLNAFSPEPSRTWVEAVAFQAVGIFAVPVYFMISGMNLLGYQRRYSTRTFFRKRLWRVGKALVLASLVCYLLFGLFPSAFGTQAVADSFGPVDFVKRFLADDINSFYWFLYSIIYLYMITPLLSLAADDKRLMQYLIVVDFAIAWGVPLLERLGVAERYLESLLHWPLYMSQDMLYFLLGYYLIHHVEWRVPAWVWLLVAGAAAAVMFGRRCGRTGISAADCLANTITMRSTVRRCAWWSPWPCSCCCVNASRACARCIRRRARPVPAAAARRDLRGDGGHRDRGEAAYRSGA